MLVAIVCMLGDTAASYYALQGGTGVGVTRRGRCTVGLPARSRLAAKSRTSASCTRGWPYSCVGCQHGHSGHNYIYRLCNIQVA